MAAAYTTPPTTETATQPPGDYTTWAGYMDDFVAAHAVTHDEEADRIAKAWRLAPNLLVCRALQQGQAVPVSALDPQWAKRYGLL